MNDYLIKMVINSIIMKRLFFSVNVLSIVSFTYGQTSLNTIGGSVSNVFGSLSYSVGQVAFHSVSNTLGSVSQGVQQAYVISTMNLEEKVFNFSLSVYPNPTTDVLNLRVGNYNQEPMNFILLDATGKLIFEGNITQEETALDIKMLPEAIYFVEINHDKQKVQSFKIIKNQ